MATVSANGTFREPPEARRASITALLVERDEVVTVRELVERFGVSPMTMHRDLDELQGRGVLRKVHGGATAQPSSLYESSLRYRLGVAQQAKEQIAASAIQHVRSGSSVIVDDSTTALALVPLLARIPQTTIITNFLVVADRFREQAPGESELLLLGGTYDAKHDSLKGLQTERGLAELRVDFCFFSVAAIDLRAGAFHQDADLARLKQSMVAVAEKAYLLADASKFRKRALNHVCKLEALAGVIVDRAIDPDTLRELRNSGITTEVAREPGMRSPEA